MTRTLGRIALAGVACAILLLIAGSVLERTLLGGNPRRPGSAWKQEVRDLFAVRSQALKESARRAAPITRSSGADRGVPATRELFAAARAALPTTTMPTSR